MGGPGRGRPLPEVGTVVARCAIAGRGPAGLSAKGIRQGRASARDRRARHPDHVDQGAERRRHLPMTGVIEKHPIEAGRPVLEHADQLARSQEGLSERFDCVGDPKPFARSANAQPRVVDHQTSGDGDTPRPATTFERPIEDRSVGAPPELDARVLPEIVGQPGRRATRKIVRGAHDGDLHWRHDANRDHVRGGEVPRPDAGIEPPRHDVDRGIVEGQLKLDVRIGGEEPCPDRRDDGGPGEVGRVDAEPPERTAPLTIQVVQRTGDLVDRRAQPFEEATSGVGRRDAPRRAVQQANPHAFFQLPDRVAQRRGRDAKTRRSRPEAEIVSNRDERRQIRKLASTHC